MADDRSHRARRFRLAFLGVTFLAHVPLAIAAMYLFGRLRLPVPGLLGVLLAALFSAPLPGRLRRAFSDRPLPLWRVLLVEEPYYAHWFGAILSVPLMVLTLLAVCARAVFAVGGTAVGESVGEAAVVACAAGLVMSSWAVFGRRRWVRVRTLDIAVEGLGAAFEGYRIAQLSDLHIGSLWPKGRAERWARRVNALDADLIALTGDYVTNGVAFHADIASVLGSMRARDGVFAVMGNHDYFGDGEPLVTLLREGGVRVLRNERATIERGSDRLVIAGVEDTWTGRADVPLTLDGWDATEPAVALAHDPQLFPQLAARGVALVLSGHTHWGQIAVPFFPATLNLSRLRYRYHAGLYREGASTLYVHPGLGTTGPPVRLGVPPEITVLRLHRATPSA